MKIEAGYRIVVLKPVEAKDLGFHGHLDLIQKEKPEIGEVVAVGDPGKKGLPVKDLKVGDKIGYRRFGESVFMIGGAEHRFVSMDDLLARFN